MTDAPDIEALREIETAWLAEELSHAIANLGYPVGCGIPPYIGHMQLAASKLFDRYARMIELARKAGLEEGRRSNAVRKRALAPGGSP